MWSRGGLTMHLALINGTVGLVATRQGQPFSIIGLTSRGAKVVEMDILADPDRIARIDLAFLH